MPTGYTSTLMEKGQSFPEFTMLCARAFGALIEMRDESLDATIPEKFEPSDYYTDRIAALKAELDTLTSMNASEREAYGQSQKQAVIKSAEQWLEKNLTENNRLQEME